MWNVGTLAPNAAAHLELKAVVTRPGAIRNIARATANETNTETGTGISTLIICAHPQPPCPPGGGGNCGCGGGGGGWSGGSQGGCAPFPAPCPDACGLTASGRTEAGQGWKSIDSTHLYIDVDTSDAGFTATPAYVTTIHTSGTRAYVFDGFTDFGATSPTGFRLYFWRADHNPLTPADAERIGLRVNWIGHQQAT
ncbi:hypothetical protein [Nonomuraea sp. NPDC003214]